MISVIKRGRVRIRYDDIEEILLPYQLAIFNPFENHKTTPIDQSFSIEYHTIYFDLEMVQEMQQTENFIPISKHMIDDTALVSEFLSLYDSAEKERERAFLQKLFSDYASWDEPSKEDPFIQEILLYIQEQDRTLEEISTYFSMSKSHLIRVFKQRVGISVHAYILNRKIHKAKNLLMQRMPIAQAALEAGFYDQSHFHKAFKSVFAMTPKEFQKSYFLQD